MYQPYFRGKQYELIAVRENAARLADSNFVPLIEPVKESLGGLQRALAAVREVDGKAVVVVNPYHGDHATDGEEISAMMRDQYADNPDIAVGVLLKDDMSIQQALHSAEVHEGHNLTFVHSGFTHAKALADGLGARLADTRHVFIEPYCGKLYRKHFQHCHRTLLRDGFERRKNRDYPELELFSDLHVTYTEEGMNAFGDFLTVGDEFSEGGGPAYAVAIHLTFVDPAKDDAMYVYHFKSRRMDTPTDPAGKFAEALEAMILKLNEPGSPVLNSNAVQEFRNLHANGHFPGLGYVKKLSMQHHVETMADFFA
jgi:hypothetical protein